MNKVKQTIFVTGIGGFIGSNLARALLKKNFEVHGAWRKSTNPWRLQDIKNKINLHEISLQDRTDLSKLLNKINPTAIFHLATYSDYKDQNKLPEMIETNIMSTANLLNASRNISYKVFVNTGSSSEYGIKNKPMKETDVLEPISFYAATKTSATLLCQVFAKEYQKPIVTLRPFSVYGPYEEDKRFIPTIIKAVAKNKLIKLTSGNQRRDFIYVEDIVDIYIKTISYGKELSGQILNMGTGNEYTNDEVVQTLFKVMGKKVSIEKGAFPKRLWDTIHWVANISRTKKRLNWKPKFTLEEGLRKTYLWYKNG